MESPINIRSIQSTKRDIKQNNKHQYRNIMNDTFATWRILKKESKTIASKTMEKNDNQFSKNTLENVPMSIRLQKVKSSSLNKKQQYKGMTLEQYFRLGSSVESKTFQMINNHTKQTELNLDVREYMKQPFQINQCQEQNYTEEKKDVITPQFNRNVQELKLPPHRIQSQVNQQPHKYSKHTKKLSKVKTQIYLEEDTTENKSRSKIRFPTMGSQTNTKILAHKVQQRKIYANREDTKRQKIVCNSILNLQFKQRGSQNTDIFIYDLANLKRYKEQQQKRPKKQRNRLNNFSVNQISLNIKQGRNSKLQLPNHTKYSFKYE